MGKSERDGDAASGLRNGGADEEMSQILDEAAGRRAVFLCGGVDENGDLYDEVWRGVITRLTFEPIP